MSLFSGFFYALFNKQFYLLVMKEPVQRGLFYLAHLALISVAGLVLYLNLHLLPQVDSLVDWAKNEKPPLTWTPEGLQISTQADFYSMYHPDYGNAVVFDMQNQNVAVGDMGESVLYVTRRALYYRNGAQVTQYPITPTSLQNYDGPSEMFIDDDFIDRVYNQAKPWVIVFGVIIAFFVYVVAKLFFALMMSGVGMLLNQRRKQPLTYPQVFVVTCFAVTAVTWLDFIRMVIPQTMLFTLGFIGSFALAFGYLYFALLKTETSFEIESPSES